MMRPYGNPRARAESLPDTDTSYTGVKKLLIATAISLSISACGGSGDSSGIAPDTPAPVGVEPADAPDDAEELPIDDAVSGATSILGSWEACLGALKFTRTFTADTWTDERTTHMFPGCGGAPTQDAFVISGPYEILGVATSDSGLPVQTIDLVTETIFGLPVPRTVTETIVFVDGESQIIFGVSGELNRPTQLDFEFPFVSQ